jgi:uncharacterized RDD family membrane protein YckC
MANQEFYIADNGQQQGPFSIEELKSKGIQRDTLVWTEGLDKWTKADYIPFLKDILKATPPPFPNTEEKTTSQQVPPPIPTVSDDKHFGYKLARRRDRLFASLLEILILYLPLMIIYDLLFGSNYFKAEYDYFSIRSLEDTIGQSIFAGILGAIFYPMWSSNFGHKIMGLKVISSVDGKDKNNAGDGFLREALKTVFSFVLLPIIWLLWDDDIQNLYDKVVKTYVVKKTV